VTDLAALPWPDVAARAARSLLAVPVGSTEQHGPHLPLSTDTDVAVVLAYGLAARRPDVLVAPAVPYGSSGEHAGFAGTLSIGQAATELLLTELGRSAEAFAGLLFVSGHGGNAGPLRRAVERLSTEGRPVRAWEPPAEPDGDAHAGRTETSLLLAVRPATVRVTEAAAGSRRPLAELWPALKSGGVAAVSANGVLGDPSGASADGGRRLLDAWTEDLVTAVAGWP
jgi:mycofactocin system creatininase family protein